jgi:hypothetical protein
VRFHDESSDAEIALARGELDVAVFWPGEPSTHLRAGHPGVLHGTRSRGVLVAKPLAGARLASPERTILALMNDALLGGDLAAWPAPWASADTMLAGAPPPRFAVDAALPGRRAIEHFLNRGAGVPLSQRPTIEIDLLDLPLAPADALAAHLDGRGVIPVFTMRCAIACRPGLESWVRTRGADALADLLDCVAAPAKP